MTTEIQRIAEQGVLTLPDAAWERARQRMDVVGPLAALDLVGHQAADDAAHSLGLSRRQVYVLIRRARQGRLGRHVSPKGELRPDGEKLIKPKYE